MSDKPVLTSCGFLIARQQFDLELLIMEHADRLDLPKGHVDPGETQMQCALRELEEETGLIGSNPELLMVMGEPTRDPRKHIVSIVYSVTTDDSEPNAGDDAADACQTAKGLGHGCLFQSKPRPRRAR